MNDTLHLSFEELRWPALVTVFSIFIYQKMVISVGIARKKFQIEVPKITGNPEFERIFRTQQNTLEQFPGFLSGLWMFCIFVNADIGAFLGFCWVILRILFARLYLHYPEKRTWATIPAYFIIILFHLSVVFNVLRSIYLTHSSYFWTTPK